MPRHRFHAFARLCSALLLTGSSLWAQGAELGDVVVRSHIGQPLVADIELTALADASAPASVKLASPDVYKGANIAMHPVLASMNMSVMRRDGRQFLHITSIKPIDSEYVHLFVEVSEGGKRNVRAQTLWLTPDPAPPPPPPPPPAAVAPPSPAAVPVPVPVPVTTPAVPLRIYKIAPRSPVAAVEQASCPSAEQVKACTAVDYKNGLLTAQIVELEEKVKALEVAIRARSELTPETKAVPKAAVKPALPRPPEPAVQAHGFPWLLSSAIVALLAAAAAACVFILRRRKAPSAKAAATTGAAWYATLAARLRRKQKGKLPAEPEAPKDA